MIFSCMFFQHNAKTDYLIKKLLDIDFIFKGCGINLYVDPSC